MNQLPFGLWKSPLTPASVSAGQRLGDAQWDSASRTLVWLEGRGDRGVLVACEPDGHPRDVTAEHTVRARVGYGGGEFTVAGGGVVYSSGGRLYRQSLAGGAPLALTPGFGQCAAPAVSPDGKHVLYVFSHERRDGLAVVDIEGRHWPRKIAEGYDFYMQPRWSTDGLRAAWISWNHPNMPWDGSALYLAAAAQGSALPLFTSAEKIAGAAGVAVLQPEFSPDGRYLSYLSDESGWFNLYLYDLKEKTSFELIAADGAQLGGPAWNQGARCYAWTPDAKRIVYIRNVRGISTLQLYDIATSASHAVVSADSYTDFWFPTVHPKHNLVAFSASSATVTPRIVAKELDSAAHPHAPPAILKRAFAESPEPDALVAPRAVSWRAQDGVEVHGLLYAAPSKGGASDAGNADGAPPPAIVRVHGGPTGQSTTAYNAETQYFATRGYTILNVNYRGSTGFGRAYMNALRGKWGILDVEDCASAAEFLTANRLADPKRLVIQGGSAGGFTVLQTLIVHPGLFRAGVCLYGVSNMFALAKETHKFEERYLDSLLGPLPQAEAIYAERSPALHADKIKDALIIFQGDIDEAVPKSQSDAIVSSLEVRGIAHEYHVFAGEGHGWRKTETIERYITLLENFLKLHVLFAS